MAEHTEFRFSGSIDGIETPQMLSADAVEGFLNSDPEDVLPIETPKQKTTPKKPEAPKQKAEEDDEDEEKVVLNTPINPEDALGDEEEEEQEEKPKSKKSKEEEEKPNEPETEEEENVFTSLTKELKELGVFSNFEDEKEVASGADFKTRFETEIKARVEDSLSGFIGQFGQDYQDAFQAIYVDGVSPRDYFQQTNTIESLEEFDLSIVDNQKQIIRDYYKSIGWPVDKISTKIQKLEDAGDLEDEAAGYHQVLLQKQQEQLKATVAAKQQEQFQKQQAEQHYQSQVVKILNDKIVKKEYDGIPVDRNFAQQIGDYLTQNKYRLPNGELLTQFDLDILNLKRPENYEKKVKLAMIVTLLESDPTLSKITKKAISKEKDEAFSNFTRQKTVAKKRGEETYTSWNLSK